jgi:hypothetical protein
LPVTDPSRVERQQQLIKEQYALRIERESLKNSAKGIM